MTIKEQERLRDVKRKQQRDEVAGNAYLAGDDTKRDIFDEGLDAIFDGIAEDMRKRCVEVCRELEAEDKTTAGALKGDEMRRKFFFGAATSDICASRISVLKP